jgi:peptidoglycan L-alanyl-D-glutamate endopeptidase CwlK
MELKRLLELAEQKASQLNPFLRDMAIELVKLAFHNGYQIIITQGYRSINEQNALYAQGRTSPGPIVTNAKGGSSNHNYRLAFDIAVLNSDNSIDWNTTSKYRDIGRLGQTLGLDWGGAWTSFVDLPHFEYTYGLSINQLKNGVKIPDYPANYIKEEDEMNKVLEYDQWAWDELDKYVGDAYNDKTIDDWKWVQAVREKTLTYKDLLLLKILIDERRRKQ